MRWFGSVTGILLAATTWTACGSESDSDSDSTDDDVASGGSVASGGMSATGGGTATGGSTGAGGSTATGGGTAAGGSTASLEDQITATCATRQQVGFLHGCTGVFASTYIRDCTAELQQAAEQCPAEVEAIADCTVYREVLDFACDADGDVTFADGVCTSETAALESCLSG